METRQEHGGVNAGHGHATHRALLYEDPSRFVAGVGAFVAAGLEQGEHVLVAVAPEKIEWVQETLGDRARAVEFADSQAMYERYGPMLRGVLGFLEQHARPGHGRARI